MKKSDLDMDKLRSEVGTSQSYVDNMLELLDVVAGMNATTSIAGYSDLFGIREAVIQQQHFVANDQATSDGYLDRVNAKYQELRDRAFAEKQKYLEATKMEISPRSIFFFCGTRGWG